MVCEAPFNSNAKRLPPKWNQWIESPFPFCAFCSLSLCTVASFCAIFSEYSSVLRRIGMYLCIVWNQQHRRGEKMRRKPIAHSVSRAQSHRRRPKRNSLCVVCVHCKQLYWWWTKIKLCVRRRDWRRPLLFSMEFLFFCGFCVVISFDGGGGGGGYLRPFTSWIFLSVLSFLVDVLQRERKPIWLQFINWISSY